MTSFYKNPVCESYFYMLDDRRSSNKMDDYLYIFLLVCIQALSLTNTHTNKHTLAMSFISCQITAHAVYLMKISKISEGITTS